MKPYNENLMFILEAAVQNYLEDSQFITHTAFFVILGNIYKMTIKNCGKVPFNKETLNGSHEQFLCKQIEEFIYDLDFKKTLEVKYNFDVISNSYTTLLQINIKPIEKEKLLTFESATLFENKIKERILKAIEKLLQTDKKPNLYNITQFTRFIQSNELRKQYLDELVKEGFLTYYEDSPNGKKTKNYTLKKDN